MSKFLDPMYIGSGTAETEQIPLQFIEAMGRAARPRAAILELGTLRWEPALPTHHTDWLPEADWTRSDISVGTDVDVVADAHDLEPFANETFDGAVAVSVWEHLARPWIAAQALARVLRPGGYAYISTHHTFPLHGYPHDYFRFSIQALALLFQDAGLQPISTGYAYPARITPPVEVTRWSTSALSPLVVHMLAVKEPLE